MKKRIITLILLIAILLVYVCFAVGCVLFSSGGLLEPISRPKYAEYFDENGKQIKDSSVVWKADGVNHYWLSFHISSSGKVSSISFSDIGSE